MFLTSLVSFCASEASLCGFRRCRAASKEAQGAQGKPRAPERWPESFGRCLDDDFPIQAFSCQVWSLSVLLERPGRPGRCQAGSQKVPGDQGKPRPPEWWPENGRFPDRRPKRSREAPDGRVLDASGPWEDQQAQQKIIYEVPNFEST